MVAAVSTTLNPNNATQTPRVPHKPPLLPSDPDNAAAARRPKSREVTSRYLSSSTPSSSSSLLRRCPSPSRSESMERTQRGTPHPNSLDFRFGHDNERGEMSAAQKLLFNSTRSLSVSFQGESLPLQVSKSKPAPTPGIGKGTPDSRKSTTLTRRTDGGRGQIENMKPVDQQWLNASHRQANCMSRSLDCMDERKKATGGSGNVVRALQNSFDGRHNSESANSLHVLPDPVACDSESVSSSSKSSTRDEGGGVAGKGLRGPRAVVVPARVWQETNNRLRRQLEPGSPSSKNIVARTSVPKKHSIDNANNMEQSSSPVRVSIGHLSRSKILASSPSTLNFGNDVGRGKMGDSDRDTHSLKMLYNRLLQWRFVNARADATSSLHSLNSESNLFSAWNGISKLCESVIAKRLEFQLLHHKLKLASMLKSQMTCLEELDVVDEDYSSSLSGITEALEARTLRLPVDDGAKAEIQDVKDAICSAVDVMQAITPSLSSWLSKVEEVNSVVSKLADVNAHERALVEHCNHLLCTVASMQITESSVRTHMLQLERIRA